MSLWTLCILDCTKGCSAYRGILTPRVAARLTIVAEPKRAMIACSGRRQGSHGPEHGCGVVVRQWLERCDRRSHLGDLAAEDGHVEPLGRHGPREQLERREAAHVERWQARLDALGQPALYPQRDATPALNRERLRKGAVRVAAEARRAR
eukprot:4277368-Prymnesium_polylepis.1